MRESASMLELPDRLTSLRVVIADDHAVYREGLAQSFRQSGVDVIAAVPNAEAAIRVVEETAADVAILDLQLPGLSGVEATRRLRRTSPATLVFVISVSTAEADIFDAILAGASEYLQKDQPADEIMRSILDAAAGKPVIQPRTATALVRRIGNRGATGAEAPAASLSEGERELLELFAEGLAIEEISAALGIDVDALHTQTASILMKLWGHERGARWEGPERG